MKKFVARVLGIFTLLSIPVFSQDSIPLKGLRANVAVSRDSYSRPYISAANDYDLYFAQGYAVASDRLWQMDMMRRYARGETAEVSGRATLEEDKRWRRYGFAGVVDRSREFLSPELKSALAAYADGVNAYIASLTDETLPIEFRILQYKPRPWTPSDSLIIGKILADALSSTWRLDLLKASLQSLPKEKLDELASVRNEYDVILFGSDRPTGPQASLPADVSNTQAGMLAVQSDLLAAAERLDASREASLRRIGSSPKISPPATTGSSPANAPRTASRSSRTTRTSRRPRPASGI